MLRFVKRSRRLGGVRAAVLRARALVSALDDALATTDRVLAGAAVPLHGPLPPALRDPLADAAEAVRRDMAGFEAEHAAAERLAADWAERARCADAADRHDLRAGAEARAREQAAAAAQLAGELRRLGEELAGLGAALGRGRGDAGAPGA